jgi:hypothetical protein
MGVWQLGENNKPSTREEEMPIEIDVGSSREHNVAVLIPNGIHLYVSRKLRNKGLNPEEIKRVFVSMAR